MIPFPGMPPITLRLRVDATAYNRALRSVRRRMRWWAAKRWRHDRPELMAFLGVFVLWLVLMVMGLW